MRKREEQLLMYRTPDETGIPNAPPPPDNGAVPLAITQESDGTKSIAISPAISMCTCHLHGKPTTAKHHTTAEQQQQWRARMSSLPTVLTPYGLCTYQNVNKNTPQFAAPANQQVILPYHPSATPVRSSTLIAPPHITHTQATPLASPLIRSTRTSPRQRASPRGSIDRGHVDPEMVTPFNYALNNAISINNLCSAGASDVTSTSCACSTTVTTKRW